MNPNEQPWRARRVIYVAAVAVGLGIGAAGVAAAASSGDSNHRASAEVDDGPERESLDQVEEQAYTDAHQGEYPVSAAAAVAAAQAAKPGRASDTHLQNEDGQTVWEVKTDDGTTVWEVQVDATGGNVVHVEADD